jgi:hypothetical protein
MLKVITVNDRAASVDGAEKDPPPQDASATAAVQATADKEKDER